MADNGNKARHDNPEKIDPAPMLGRVGDGATLESGEYISRELREMTERERAHREQEKLEKHRE